MALTKSIKEIIEEDKTGLLANHNSWKRVYLRDIAQVINGYPFESKFFNPKEGIPLIRIRDVFTGTTDTFYAGKFDKEFFVYPGDLLIGMDGDFNSARWKGKPALLNQRVCKLFVNKQFYSEKFLEYL